MAVVTAPLHSQSASGQFGKTLIYQPSRGQNVVRAYGKPNWTSHPPTGLQLAVQAMNKLLMEAWPAIPAIDQATWDLLALPRNELRCNSYLRENFKRLRSGRYATDCYPPAPRIRKIAPEIQGEGGEFNITGTNLEHPLQVLIGTYDGLTITHPTWNHVFVYVPAMPTGPYLLKLRTQEGWSNQLPVTIGEPP